MKAAKLRKKGFLSETKEEIKEEEYSVKSLVKIIIILLVLFGIFYGITFLVLRNKNVELLNDEYTVIDTEKITISNMLSQKQEKYYVLLTKESLYTKGNINGLDSNYVKLYEQKINEYKNSTDNPLNFYKADLDDAINKNFIGEKTNITDDLNELSFSDEAFIEVKNKKIKKYYVGHKDILNALQELE